MKKIILRTCLVAFLIWGATGITKAQFEDAGKFIEGIKDPQIKHDAELLMSGYLEPYVDGFASGLSGGWYNTAKPHKKLGFDITASVVGVLIPDDKLLFDVGALDLQELEVSGNEMLASTIAGDDQQVSLESNISVEDHDEIPLASFETPKGTGVKTLAVPSVKAGVGLPFKTDLMVRYLPRIAIQDVEIGIWGVGLKHSLKQYIPIVKRVPALHLSAMAGFTQLNSSTNVSITPQNIGDNVNDLTDTKDFDNQSVGLTLNSFTANLLASIDIPVLTVYAGLGIVSNKSELALYGNYPTSMGYDLETNQPAVKDEHVEEDPIKLTFTTDAADGMLPRANAGIRLKFAVVTFHVDYVYSGYSLITSGLGFRFR